MNVLLVNVCLGGRQAEQAAPRTFVNHFLVISPASYAGRRVSRGQSKQGRRYDLSAIFVVRTPPMVSAGHPTPHSHAEKRVAFVLNVLCGIHDASKIHGLQQGNKIATDKCFCVLSLVVPALNPSTALYIGYRISAHLCQCDHSSRQRKMDEQARRPVLSVT
jgi:hypothetical protein